MELLSYSYEIEHLLALRHLEKIDDETVIEMVKMYTDLKMYNTSMGRDVNFRFYDLSSALNHHASLTYLQRLMTPGDDLVLKKIITDKPILNIATHNIFSYSLPVFKALGSRCLLINMTRHPIYMIKQNALNMERLLGGSPKNFSVDFEYKGEALPFYTKGWESDFISLNSTEKSVFFIAHESERQKIMKNLLKEVGINNYYDISFESLVLEPEYHLKNICRIIGSEMSASTDRVMKEQNVPRRLVSHGIDLEIYRRCGWKLMDGATEQEIIQELSAEVKSSINEEVEQVLERLVTEYESRAWSPRSGLVRLS